MPTSMISALTYTLIPAIMLLVAGGLATVRRPSAQWTSYFQHFAAGVVLAALGTELLSEVMRRHEALATAIGFGVGIAVMLGIREVAEKFGGGHGHGPKSDDAQEPHAAHDHDRDEPTDHAKAEKRRSNLGLVLSVGVDLLVDGLLIGLGFAAGDHMGVLLTLALTIEVAFLALSTAAKATRRDVMLRMVMFGAFMMTGAAIGSGVGHSLSGPAMAGALSFGCAALLYLVAEELLVEAHEANETPISGAMLGLGFLVLVMLDMLVW